MLVIGCWAVAAAVSWWTAPRPSTYEQARADIAGRQVVAFQWGDRWGGGDTRRWFADDTLYSSNPLGPLFGWRTGDGRVHWIDSGDFDQVMATGAVDATVYDGPGAIGLAQDLQAAGIEQRYGDISVLGGLVGGIGFFLTMLVLLVLLVGPEPVLGTKWYWFWIVFTMPYGLGLLFWTLRDRPWAARPPAREPRRDGWLIGLATGVLLGVLITVALHLLNGAFGDRWIPYGNGWWI
ncbi:hypothetical protein SAMN04489716_2275 [Actinoplanes derwentensis]|uniref:Uncharacterized protein n=1 Tax=Actinoplanes derwentensis TaxID=113562 RepID=A0A1H1X075_9ACTN|nr:hypothetical protein Ade03nite_47060 [Actinoplanes derwentensis]SDT02066.1 hypothetical protein SAMN04489716_2275 [Actinoplanes derwentensis]